jgi:AraC-like DNA-binding protein
MSVDGHLEIPFAHPAYVRCLLDCLNSRGVSPSRVLEKAGVTWQELSDAQQILDLSVFRRIAAHALKCSGEPALGLLAGSMLQPYHTAVGLGAVTSENVEQGLRFWTQFASLIFGGLDFQLEIEARWSTLKVKSRRPICDTHIFVMHSVLGAHCRLLEGMLGRPVDELCVGLPYPRPMGNDDFLVPFVRKLEFDRPCMSFRLPSELLHSRCIHADAKAFAKASQTCARIGLELGHGTFVHRARRALQERLETNPDSAQLASDLGVSPRALRSRLAEARLTLSDLKDELRKSLANWYLQHTELSIEAIASQLGYADPANFTRKFKSWYSVAPTKMRQEFRIGLSTMQL